MTALNTLTVYLGSSGRAKAVFKNSAETLGQIIGQSRFKLVYGGMDAGLMGLLAVNALSVGGHVTGIIPQKLKDSERILGNLSETILVEDLWERKKRMFLRADAIVALPGGFGTLDESLEVLYWGYLGLHNKPLLLVNVAGYWNTLLEYLRTLPDFDPRFLIVVDTVEDVIPALERWAFVPPLQKEPEHYPHFEDEITRGTSDPILIDKASVENSYYAVCALGLKQLAKHDRPIGFLNTGGQFDGLLNWFVRAQEETFITDKCLQLFIADTDETALREALKHQPHVEIDLHAEKWGKRV